MLHAANLILLLEVILPRFVSIIDTLQTSITSHQLGSPLCNQVFGFLQLLKSVLGLLTV